MSCFWTFFSTRRDVTSERRRSTDSTSTSFSTSSFLFSYRYTLGDLNFLVRYKVDAQKAPVWQPRRTSSSVPDLTTFFQTHTNTTTPIPFASPSLLSYQISKTTIPAQSSLLAIRTKPGHQFFLARKQWDQLFFAQIPALLVAFYNDRGIMRKVCSFPLEGGGSKALEEFEE